MLRRRRSWKNFAQADRNNEGGTFKKQGQLRAIPNVPQMTSTRRKFTELGLGAAFSLASKVVSGQGVSTPLAKPLPRAAPSGRPFNARFIDVARQAGLRAT